MWRRRRLLSRRCACMTYTVAESSPPPGAASSAGAARAGNAPEPMRGNEGAHIVGPANPARQAEEPFTMAPPSTGHGTLPNMKWSFPDSNVRIEEGGWARETTVRELPLKAVAGVEM